MIELLTNAEMAEADRLTIAGGVAGIELMERAGRAVAERVAALSPREVVVVAGPGNNGGDGFVAARLLAEWKYRTRVLLVGDRARLRGDAAIAGRQWNGPLAPASRDALPTSGAIIDALFGAGLDRPVEGIAREMIEAMNACGVPVVSVDLPSGINGTTGAVMGAAVRARETVTFFRRKPAHLLLPGRLHCGRVHVADIGIKPTVLDEVGPCIFADEPPLWRARFPFARLDGHKYDRGHAVVVSGGMSFTGAARLAARGALRAGAGLVTIASPRDALAVNAAASLAVMVRAVDGARELAGLLADRRNNAVVLGPGLGVGAATRELVAAALDGERAVVLDADALTSFAESPAELFALVKARVGAATILTPHAGEFSRLFMELVKQSRLPLKLELARGAAAASGAIIVFKGADTVIAEPGERAAVAANAPPYLATAGTGDVLAGMIGGLLAQGMPAFEAASAAVWLHGEAGTEAGPGMISEDLPEALPPVMRRLYGDRGTRP